MRRRRGSVAGSEGDSESDSERGNQVGLFAGRRVTAMLSQARQSGESRPAAVSANDGDSWDSGAGSSEPVGASGGRGDLLSAIRKQAGKPVGRVQSGEAMASSSAPSPEPAGNSGGRGDFLSQIKASAARRQSSGDGEGRSPGAPGLS